MRRCACTHAPARRRPATAHSAARSRGPPTNWDLPRALFDAVSAATPHDYHGELSVAPGTKVGGYPSWCQLPEWPPCPSCNTTMTHLATVASWEHAPGDGRWLPTGEAATDDRLRQPAGLMLGDVGSIYLFTCTICPHRPYGSLFQNA